MNLNKAMRLISLSVCFVFITGCADSFGEFTSGMKTLTGSAKDVVEMTSDQKEPTKAPPSTKKPATKKPAPSQPERVQGG